MKTQDLINAIESGKTLEIESAFQEVFAEKVTNAIANLQGQVSSSLFTESKNV